MCTLAYAETVSDIHIFSIKCPTCALKIRQHVRGKEDAFSVLVRKPEGKNYLKDLDADGRIMLRGGKGVMDWIDLAQKRDLCWSSFP
jgi:hypothetical protein